tara:strand:- start:788 stop:2017 length:1230 start_codon:yes stop_codon:yes gene_type:complete
VVSLNIWYFSAHDQPRGLSSRTYDYSLELVKRGHKVTFFTNSFCHWSHLDILEQSEKWRIENIDGIRIVWLKTIPYSGNGLGRGLNMLSNALRCLQVASVLSDVPDVVLGPSVPLGTGWAAARIAKRKNAPFVFEVRDVWPAILVDDGGLSKWSPIYFAFRHLEKQLYRQASVISSTLPYLCDHVAESGGDPVKVHWTPNGVSLNRFTGKDTYDGGKNMPLTVMYVGGFGQAHDVITLVRAANILNKRQRGKFKFIMIGDGVKKQECVDESKKLGLTNIEFRDSVPKSEVPNVQMESDILVACVTQSDSYRFGLNLNKIYDYYGSSRPVVFSGTAPNDPAKESGSGISVDPEKPDLLANAFEELLAMTPSQRKRMGEIGRQHVESKYNMNFLGEKMEQLLINTSNINVI